MLLPRRARLGFNQMLRSKRGGVPTLFQLLILQQGIHHSSEAWAKRESLP
jgi:hypothetical protein